MLSSLRSIGDRNGTHCYYYRIEQVLMRKRGPTKYFRLDDTSYSALARSVAGQLIRRLGTGSDALAQVLKVVDHTRDRMADTAASPVEPWQGTQDQTYERKGSYSSADARTRQAQLDTIRRLALAAEFRDDDTGAHIVRVGGYSALIAKKLELPAEKVQLIYHAAHLHDVGKIGIPDRILMKRGRLSDEEFDIVKTHTTIGAEILADPEAEVLRLARHIALSHHERWDGKGYPLNLSKGEIPLAARIVSLADSFDAITSDRPYRRGFQVNEACKIIELESEKQFDPEIVAVFLDNIDQILAIMRMVNRPWNSVALDEDQNETEAMAENPTGSQDLGHRHDKELKNAFEEE